MQKRIEMEGFLGILGAGAFFSFMAGIPAAVVIDHLVGWNMFPPLLPLALFSVFSFFLVVWIGVIVILTGIKEIPVTTSVLLIIGFLGTFFAGVTVSTMYGYNDVSLMGLLILSAVIALLCYSVSIISFYANYASSKEEEEKEGC